MMVGGSSETHRRHRLARSRRAYRAGAGSCVRLRRPVHLAAGRSIRTRHRRPRGERRPGDHVRDVRPIHRRRDHVDADRDRCGPGRRMDRGLGHRRLRRPGGAASHRDDRGPSERGHGERGGGQHLTGRRCLGPLRVVQSQRRSPPGPRSGSRLALRGLEARRGEPISIASASTPRRRGFGGSRFARSPRRSLRSPRGSRCVTPAVPSGRP